MKFYVKLLLLFSIAHISFAAAMKQEYYNLVYKDEYIISSYYGCLPKLIIKNKVVLFNKENNNVIAEARYYLTYLSSTAELKKAHAWFNDDTIKNIFLVEIIKHIKVHYPHIKRLECPHRSVAWDFK